MKVLLTAVLLLVWNSSLAREIHHMHIDNDKNELILSILKLALSKESDDYVFKQASATNANIIRNSIKINTGILDIVWSGTSQALENNLLPVRVPVLKGLFGYRLFIIRPESQADFSRVKILADLTKYRAGQGTFWEDSKILRRNNIETITSVKYQNLFPMLAGKRFDFFPRGVHEPWDELEQYSSYGLTVEKEILLIYPFAMYFFVSKDNKELADKLERGFRKAIDDGSYDRLFFNNPLIKNAFERAQLKNRRVIHITNDMLPKNTPLDDKKLWLDFESFDRPISLL
ncbi:MAG: transporter substrate-binding domain-containing protein [Kangiellaceae bacterium]|nr:transporter substrate-binding domain-containing protein [Kangiellaceae bacterium]